MGENSKIEWTDHTFNPWLGCTKISPACTNCYAESWAKRSGLVIWGENNERRRTSESYWKQPIKWNVEAEELGIRRRVFCASLADVFEPRSDLISWRLQLLDLIRRTPYLDWLLLTKRPEWIMQLLFASIETVQCDDDRYDDTIIWIRNWLDQRPPQNIWLGTTVENQEMAAKRIPSLLKMPATIRFLSCEPLLGPINFQQWLARKPLAAILIDIHGIKFQL